MSLAFVKHNAVYVGIKETKKSILRKLRLPQYLGSTYRCPVCETSLNSYKPIWDRFRRVIMGTPSYPFRSLQTFNWQAYSCPACDASDRDRLFILYLERIAPSLDPTRRHRMIEFGPSLATRRKLKSHRLFDHRGADLYRNNVDERLDITDMRPYGDGSVDIVLCSHVLEHVPEDRKALREIHRVLRPDGFAIVMVPLLNGKDDTDEDLSISPAERDARYGDSDHVRQYGIRDFRERLEAAGFQVDLLGKDYFSADAFRKAGIADDSILYVVRKAART